MNRSRRVFLQTGIAGSALLCVLRVAPLAQAGAPTRSDALGADERAILAAIAPVILAGALPAEEPGRARAVEAVVAGVATGVAGLPPHLQREMAELFTLLGFPVTRRFVARVSRPWPEASAGEIAAFLQAWRTSRFALLQSAYHALHDLVVAAWYGQRASWGAIGYPGPPDLP